MTSPGTHHVERLLKVDFVGPFSECPCCGSVGPAELAGEPCTWCLTLGHGVEWEQAKAAEAAARVA